jgi:hypothetical protein
MDLRKAKTFPALVMALATLTALPSAVAAQGSIFGQVRNSNMSTPPDGAVQFLGFINNSDKEIRIESCIGAGYDGGSGNWYDDFQNYLSEAAGLPYHYYFFDTALSERVILAKTIPSNSFQREDVTLAPAVFPKAPDSLYAYVLDDKTVQLAWSTQSGVTWHVYRRDGSSDGSFFRIDNPAGDRSNHGVTSPRYIDRTVNALSSYSYIVVAESDYGNYSPASQPLFVDVTSCCQGHVGDINGVGGDIPTIGDIALLIDHMFISYTVPECLAEADVNQSGGVNPQPDDISLVDIVLIINYLYIDFVPMRLCTDAAR